MDYIKLITEELESNINRIVEQNEKIYSYGDDYDYKVSNNKWYATKKGQNKWFSMDKYPKNIANLDKKYPNARKIVGKVTSDLKKGSKTVGKVVGKSVADKDSKVEFNNTDEGNSFRKFVNQRFPKISKKYDLDITGKHNNSYIMKVANLKMILNKDKYGYNKGESAKMFYLWKNKDIKTGKNDKGFIDSVSDYAAAGFNKVRNSFNSFVDSITSKYTPTKGHYVIPFAFPEYEPKLETGTPEWVGMIAKYLTGAEKNGTYGKLGHSGIATISPNGDTNIFEFGRYSGAKSGHGITKSVKLGKIAKIEDGVLSDFESLCKKIKSKTQGDGPRLKMDCRLVPVVDVNSAIETAKQTTSKKYEAFDMDSSDSDANCATYTLEIAKSAGVPLGSYCFPNPTSVIKAFNDYSLESITV